MQNVFLELETRRHIYECIKKSPGLHLREVQRRTKLATGSLDYHLHFLQKNGLLRTEKTGLFVRYYTTDTTYDSEKKDLLTLLRQKNIRHILVFLLQKKKATASVIAQNTGLSPSNLSWYMKTLEQKNLVTYKKKGRFRFYTVTNKKEIVECLVTYRESFFDQLVDGFIDTWEMDK